MTSRMRQSLVAPSRQRPLERSGSGPAGSDRSWAVVNWNQHGIPRRARQPYRLGGGGGWGWAASQQALEVGTPGPAVRPCRRRQPCPTGCLAQEPSHHEHLACRHQLLNLAATAVDLAAPLVAGVWRGSDDGQQVGEPSDGLTGQPYVHLVLLLLRKRDVRWHVVSGEQHPGCPSRGRTLAEVPSAWILGVQRSVPPVTAAACQRSQR